MACFFKKDPDETDDFSVDWANETDSAESIDSIVWTVPTGITQVQVQLEGDVATIRLSGGTVSTSYTIACKATLDSGRILERSIYIRVDER